MATTASIMKTMEIIVIAGLLTGCAGGDPESDAPVVPPTSPPAEDPPAAEISFAARVAITATGAFDADPKEISLSQRRGDANADATTACTWLAAVDVAAGQRRTYDCGAIELNAGSYDLLDGVTLAVGNHIGPAPEAPPAHEIAISEIAIDVVRLTGEEEQPVRGQRCTLNERLGKAVGDTALPNLLHLQFGPDGCALVSREQYLNTVWLSIGGAPQSEFQKYLYAGQEPGARPFVGGFSDATYVALDFATPAAPAPDGLIFLSLSNIPSNGTYDAWVLTGVTVRSGSGTVVAQLGTPISCSGNDGDASQVTCWTDGTGLTCSAADLCFR